MSTEATLCFSVCPQLYLYLYLYLLNEVGSARLGRLLHEKVISYSKNFRRKGGVNAR